MNDDEFLRRALHRPPEPISSYRVLQDLRPTMRRARNRRRATVGATAALLLAGGGAGVLALASAPVSPTVRTTSPDHENGAVVSTLPPVSETHDVSDGDTHRDQAVPTTPAPPTVIAPPAPESEGEEPAEAPETVGATPAPDSPPNAPPSDRSPSELPTTTAAPELTPPPAPTSQRLESECGDVVVEIDGGTIRIASIVPLPGYTSRVATDGPESVEMTFLGTDHGCEVHAELRSSGLDVEIQNSLADD